MKTLLVLRHAKSSWKDSSLSDHDRPLNKRGKEDAPRMGQLLRREELLPDMIISSTARRARTTAELVAEESGFEGELLLSDDLYAFGAEPYLEVLREIPDEYQMVMVVGHNPSMEELVEALSGEYQRFPTAALAQIELPLQSWGQLDEECEGRLVNVWRPKEL